MKIATWNIERLKHHKDIEKILSACESSKADILVLTETDVRVHPDYEYYFHTSLLKDLKPDYYKSTENRVSIYSNCKFVKQYETFDRFTSLCVELETERGNLLVYGTIIGIFGNREKSFETDLIQQMDDIRRLSNEGYNICVTGDYNLSFCDNYYFTQSGREAVIQTFSECRVSILTKDRTECIDHIAVSDRYAENAVMSPLWCYVAYPRPNQ